jgi:hypothetical protein
VDLTGGYVLLLLGAALVTGGVIAGVRARRARAGRQAPPLRRGLSIAATSAGALCVVAALILLGSDAGDGGGARSGPVTVAITNELGPGQVSERITVFVDGRRVGTMNIDERVPRARLMVKLASAGTHEYRLESKRRLRGGPPVVASSTGEVNFDGRTSLAVYSDEDGKAFLLPQP